MNLENLGWNQYFQQKFDDINNLELSPARIIREEKGSYIINTGDNEISSEISGKLRYKTINLKAFPSVGDWVLVKTINDNKHSIIYHILERENCFTRKVPISGGRKVRDINGRKIVLGGSTEEQIIAANIDVVFIVLSCDDNFSLRSLERYLLLTYNSGATPVIILNKIDLCNKYMTYVLEIESVAIGVDIHPISALDKKNLDVIRVYTKIGKTIGIFGSSGVGKSTLINCLLGTDELVTSDVRDKDSKGRHTTTWRELVILPSGGILIDTPGMRELQVWIDNENLSKQFLDIEELFSQCRFKNCSHTNEPGCKVRERLENGTLDPDRYNNYLLLSSETLYLDDRRREKEERLLRRKKYGKTRENDDK